MLFLLSFCCSCCLIGLYCIWRIILYMALKHNIKGDPFLFSPYFKSEKKKGSPLFNSNRSLAVIKTDIKRPNKSFWGLMMSSLFVAKNSPHKEGNDSNA